MASVGLVRVSRQIRSLLVATAFTVVSSLTGEGGISEIFTLQRQLLGGSLACSNVRYLEGKLP